MQESVVLSVFFKDKDKKIVALSSHLLRLQALQGFFPPTTKASFLLHCQSRDRVYLIILIKTTS